MVAAVLLSALQVLQFPSYFAPLVGVCRSILHFCYDWPQSGQFSIQSQKLLLAFRQVFFGVDGVYRAFWFTQTAVDTFFGIDYKEVGPFVKTVDGAHLDTIS
jgi:hypothetical protein